MNTKYMRKFLAHPGNVSDASLAAMYAHCQDGKLAFSSCCCFISCGTANHPLRGFMFLDTASDLEHLLNARLLPHARDAEWEFMQLAQAGIAIRLLLKLGRLLPGKLRARIMWDNSGDEVRRRRALPIIANEMKRRAKFRNAFTPEFLEMVFSKKEREEKQRAKALSGRV
jgi:hypothetical protein